MMIDEIALYYNKFNTCTQLETLASLLGGSKVQMFITRPAISGKEGILETQIIFFSLMDPNQVGESETIS